MLVGGGELLQTVKVVHTFCFLSYFFLNRPGSIPGIFGIIV